MTSALSHLECARCGVRHDASVLQNRCSCGGTLLVRYDLARVDGDAFATRPAGPFRYEELLPLERAPVTLGEPETPLLELPRLSAKWGIEVLIKDDAPLPGGTFKARGAMVGLSRARELGVERLVMPSAGNAGGAWSLYAARAGLPITVTMARSAPVANHAEVTVAGGDLVLVDGTIADAARRAREIAAETGAFLAATFSEPYRLEGKKTAWLETFERLGWRFPRTIVFPVGGGVALIAAAKAAAEVRALGLTSDEPPRLVGVQPAGCAPIVRAFTSGSVEVDPWGDVEPTAAAGLRVPAPSEGDLVVETVRASGGTMVAVGEDELRAWIGRLARSEGVWACPEGAAAFAGAARLVAEGRLDGPAVVYNTGTGAKYTDVLA